MDEKIIEMRGMSKRFPAVVACDNVTIEFRKGEVHCIVGENGAGKTTLMEILIGKQFPDSGDIYFHDQKVQINSVADSNSLGIFLVPQFPSLIDKLTVAQNILLGSDPKQTKRFRKILAAIRPFKNLRNLEEKIAETSHRLELDINPRELVKNLSFGEKQKVEILRGFLANVQVLIMDEPTSRLSPVEVKPLLDKLKAFAKQGITIIYITHSISDVLEMGDRITVMRNGRITGQLNRADNPTERDIVKLAGYVKETPTESSVNQAEGKVLEVQSLTVRQRREVFVRKASFDTFQESIFALVGVPGNGQSQLMQALQGLMPREGKIMLNREDITHANSEKILKHASIIPEDLIRMGLIPEMTVVENLMLGSEKLFVTKFGNIDWKKARQHAEEMTKKFSIKVGTIDNRVRNLSGGNKMMLMLAREIERAGEMCLAFDPTRGLDFERTDRIHNQLEQKSHDTSILLITTNLSEVRRLSPQLAVIHSGRVSETFNASSISDEEIGIRMMGGQVKK